MEKFILEIPDFVPHDICEFIIKNFETDERKVEGSLY
jgi:hypothetical protein